MVGRHFGYKTYSSKKATGLAKAQGPDWNNGLIFFFKLLNFLFDNSGDNPLKVKPG